MHEQTAVPLADLTTMRVGGPADRVVTVTTTDELVDAVREVDDADEPLLVVSGGSNLIAPDAGFRGTVVHIATTGITRESAESCSGAMVRVAAGESWDELVALAVTEGWAGVEALSGIPGLTGATPIQNVGAYGQDVSQTIAQVRTWDRQEQSVRTFFNTGCGFTYRSSRFKGDSRYVVLDVLFQLELADLSTPVGYAALADGLGVELGARAPLGDVREAVLDQRRQRGMVLDADDHDTWSCGSFFTNPILPATEFDALVARAATVLGEEAARPPRYDEPDGRVKTSAAWLIEKAGFGRGFGLPAPAALSTKHTLALTNRGGATASDVVALARQLRDGVLDRFGVRLVNEPVLVGDQL
ncbi:UDP-N-acetylenolpyruvoylglucosamine reductase [Humibacillus sp. DSM 29435]|uniref:UDP-N-acetylmuramate dehydrogenase n=1 Tax=Humibacillus sp. DSM 29435 TaxID=1869167 RepID=UPI000872E9E8|nr:UDP-N-acetylmuramate dehydrogenase [Humibacillus sp. DSM 29435]OFE16977.1 UDP-N-acetylenolpyruvoylglucosamine reductase [Humibacillus sp. DSM 29435]